VFLLTSGTMRGILVTVDVVGSVMMSPVVDGVSF